MSDTLKNESLSKPQGKENKEAKEIKVPIKFNKETREISLEEASALAQKGLKFEAIEKEYNLLKDLASKENKSVPKFIEELVAGKNTEEKTKLLEKCGGDEEIAERILKSEGKKTSDNGFAELKESFPEIKSPEDLPEEVLENAQLKGTFLLDEYLRYLLIQDKKIKETNKKLKNTQKASTGSLSSQKGAGNPETEEFLKGLWG